MRCICGQCGLYEKKPDNYVMTRQDREQFDRDILWAEFSRLAKMPHDNMTSAQMFRYQYLYDNEFPLLRLRGINPNVRRRELEVLDAKG